MASRCGFAGALALGATMWSGAVSAADFGFTGSFSHPNDRLHCTFSIEDDADVVLRTYGYAGGTLPDSTVIHRGGFDPQLVLFASDGAYITGNDDGGSNVDEDPDTSSRYDSYLEPFLSAGSYTLVMTAYNNDPSSTGGDPGDLADGFDNDGNFNGRFRRYAVGLLNVDSASCQLVPFEVEPIPTLSQWGTILLSLLFAGLTIGPLRGRIRDLR